MNKPLVEISGFNKLYQQIKLLSNDKDKKRELLLILKQLAKPTLEVVKSKTPIGKGSKKRASGSLKASQGLILGTKGDSIINPTIYVGPKVFKGQKRARSGRWGYGDGWYAHMVDRGHKIYNNPGNVNKIHKKGILAGKSWSTLSRKTHKRPGNVQGIVVGKNFMGEAFAITNGQVTSDAEKRVTTFIQRRIDKLSA